jgi:hypothetical protein
VEAFMLPKVDLGNFVADLKKDREVLGPVAKVDEFVFAPIDDVGALCLDYDTTILPPAKKFIHMPGEVLFEFESAVHGKDQALDEQRVLFGVHACDLNGLLSLDKVFLETYPDPYYKSRRENTLIIALNCVSPCKNGFCASFNTGPEADMGFDLCLTDIGDQFVVDVGSDKGKELVSGLTPATNEDFVDLLRHKRKQVLILIDKSSGTKYENAKEEIIDLTKVHIQKHLGKRIKNSSIIDDVFYHILANNFLEGVLEIARHYKNEEWANNMVELLSKQYFYGINFLVK